MYTYDYNQSSLHGLPEKLMNRIVIVGGVMLDPSRIRFLTLLHTCFRFVQS